MGKLDRSPIKAGWCKLALAKALPDNLGALIRGDLGVDLLGRVTDRYTPLGGYLHASGISGQQPPPWHCPELISHSRSAELAAGAAASPEELRRFEGALGLEREEAWASRVAADIAAVRSNDPQLTRIDWSHHLFQIDEAVRLLAGALLSNTHLRDIDLRSCATVTFGHFHRKTYVSAISDGTWAELDAALPHTGVENVHMTGVRTVREIRDAHRLSGGRALEDIDVILAAIHQSCETNRQRNMAIGSQRPVQRLLLCSLHEEKVAGPQQLPLTLDLLEIIGCHLDTTHALVGAVTKHGKLRAPARFIKEFAWHKAQRTAAADRRRRGGGGQGKGAQKRQRK